MEEIDKKEVFQAIVLMDTFNKNLRPITNYTPIAFLSVAGVPIIEYALKALAVGGITKTILFCCKDPHMIEKFLKETQSPWKYVMDIQVKSSETCQSVGDVMREINAASLVKEDFILFGINTVTNIHLASFLEQHKQTVKNDKGAAITLVLKEMCPEHILLKPEKSFFLAANNETKKVLVHDKFKRTLKKTMVPLPTKHLLSNAEVIMHHSLLDPNIAVCSPSVPPLFAGNLDLQTLDDLVHGLVIQEDNISADSVYFALVGTTQYAAAVTNWRSYRIICFDILHNYADPLNVLTGAYKEFEYTIGRRGLRNKTANLSRSCKFGFDILIGGDSVLGDNTYVSESIIDNNVIIGNNVTIEKSFIMDKAVIKDNVKIINSFIDRECSIEEDCIIEGGTVIAQKLTVKPGTKLNSSILEELDSKKGESLTESGTEFEIESVGSDEDEFIGLHTVWSDSSSRYSSEESDSSPMTLDDMNMFLGEVIDDLARCYEEKLNCDFLISKINGSGSAYNIQLHEVNFFVVRALLSLPLYEQTSGVLGALEEVIKFFRPIFANYIKSKSSIMDCLMAVEETCIQCEWLKGNCGRVLHMLYDADIVDEESLLEFYEHLKENGSRLLQYNSVTRFFEWLQEAEEESDE